MKKDKLNKKNVKINLKNIKLLNKILISDKNTISIKDARKEVERKWPRSK